MVGNSSPQTVSTKQQRIAELARQLHDKPLTSLSYHVDQAWLTSAYEQTRRNGAVGIDGTTWQDYGKNLDENLQSLLDRAKTGDTYRAPAVRRVYIPKANGERRGLGIPTLEDKVLQRAVLMAVEPVYEQIFLPCSYGFRPGRSQHQCLNALRNGLMQMSGGTVLELDIRKCFDSFDHKILQQLLRERIRDGVVLRLIGKWLNAGVLEDGRLWFPEAGSPQGGVISPLLANVFLHYVLDVWFESEVKPVLRGPAFMVRYADDAVLCFKRDEDAQRVMRVIGKRFARFGLEIHPAKTRLTHFRRPPRSGPSSGSGKGGGNGLPDSFEFLGFCLHWARSRQNNWVIHHKTAPSRLRRSIANAKDWLGKVRHWRLRDQYAGLVRKLRGHDAYYGRYGNYRSLLKLRRAVERLWLRSLRRRSQRRHATWEWYKRVLQRYPLPKPRITHNFA